MAEARRSGRVTVVGTGSWGTTLAILAARQGLDTYLLARTEAEASLLLSTGENSRFMPGFTFPPCLTPTADPDVALRECDLILMVVPSQAMRTNIRSLKPYIAGSDAIIVSAAKGLELSTQLRMTEVIAAELGDSYRERLAALSGPNLAREIVAGRPATTVIGANDLAVARRAQDLLTSGRFRVYTNPDVVGVELGGALKNIIALAAGMADGMQAGDSSKAALTTRGLAEIARLGIAAGASLFTFAGLAGLGDLIATCASPLSRNRFMGQELAKGKTLDEIREGLGGQIAEGVSTTVAARELAARFEIEMPITEQLYAIIFEGKSPLDGLNTLLTREPTDELLSLGMQVQGA